MNWQPGSDITSTAPVELVYIDSRNRICTVKLTHTELADFQYPILAWRTTPPAPKPRPWATVYWNHLNRKFWPLAAKRPPNPGLPGYFRIDIYQNPDGTLDWRYTINSREII